SVLAGSGRLLLLAGEAGIGKTALLHELARAVPVARVLWGTCWAGGGAPAYWPWTQVLRGLGDPDDPDGPDGTAARLLGSGPAGPEAAGTGAEAADARFRLFDAVARRLLASGEPEPLVVVLDDLQWADEPSLRLLEFVARQLATIRVLVLGAYRDDEAGPAVRALAGVGQVLPLGGLSAADVAALMVDVAGPAAAPPDPRLAERVRRGSAGNPFLVRELTRLLLAQGGWDGIDGAAHLPVPDTVRDTLERRIARLSQPCASVLAVAALDGPVVRTALVDEVAAPAGGCAALLDEAVRARVLQADAEGRHRFVHDLFREVLVAGLPAARRRELHAVLGRALQHRRDAGGDVGAAELAAHFLAAGCAEVADDAVSYAVAAAHEATARLGHEEACRHLTRAMDALDLLDQPDPRRRTALLLELAAARDRSGDTGGAREAFRTAADLARRGADPAGLAGAAIGLQGLGSRSGTSRSEAVELLREAAAALPAGADPALRARVLAGLARALRHGSYGPPAVPAQAAAEEAVALAREVGDPRGLADALLALHDARWRPGSARQRLAVLDQMHEAAQRAGDRDLVALAGQLRATALLELGDPAAPGELAGYAVRADELGHARGRWFALTRRATLALVAGRIDEAVELARRGLELGRAIGQPDAAGAFGTLNASLGLLGHRPEGLGLGSFEADPLQPLVPLLHAWVLACTGRSDEAAAVFAGFATDLVPDKQDLEMLAILAATASAVGSPAQREQAYRRLAPHAGTHVVVGGCAAYSGAVDHHLGRLAAALGRPTHAADHLRAAVAMHERLGAPAWAALSRDALEAVTGAGPDEGNVFRPEGTVWTLAYGGVRAHVPDVKGLHDLATLLATPGRDVHVFTLLGRAEPATGADPVLDEAARRAYRARLADLDAAIEHASSAGERARAEDERDALVRELTAAAGLGGRPRRLGDETERARKTVTARIRDALGRIGQEHPALAAHLRASVRTGTSCRYDPPEPVRWRLRG
ncbi:MAG: AAA family ATPase, partial [Pseudonocardia sp.]